MAFSTNGTCRGSGFSSEINVTPLIDVLLVMLIIFMVIVPVAPRGLNSSLPSTSSSEVEDDVSNRPILVRVESGETVRYIVDGADVNRMDVASRLSELLAKKTVRHVFVEADAELDFGAVAGVIDMSKAGGADSIGLMTPALGGQSK
jgi:biopolymer transport protein TolR